MKEILKNTIILFIITCIAGGLLGGVYSLTANARKQTEEKAKNDAYRKVINDAVSFEEIPVSNDISSYIESRNLSVSSVSIDEIVAGKDKDGNIPGYAITVTSKEGYGGNITFTVGISSEGTINDISILTINETAGLGMKAKEDDFLNQFKNKNVNLLHVVKSGAKTDDEIDAISSATITSNAMVNGVNTAICTFEFITQDGGTDKNE